MFERAAALNLSWNEGKPILEDYASLTNLINKETYSQSDKTKMHDIMSNYKGLMTKKESKYLILREVREKLLNSKGEIIVNGRDDWIGWFDLAKEPINEVTIMR